MKNKNKGMTMVEVIVAFAVLLIGLSGMYKVTVYSGQQIKRANDVKNQVDSLMEAYYTGGTQITTEEIQIKYVLEGKEPNSALKVAYHWNDYSKDGYHVYAIEEK